MDMQRNCYTSKTRTVIVKFLHIVVLPAMAMTIAFAPHTAAAPATRSICSQVGVISPQFASFNAEVGDRDLGQELRDLVEQPTSMDPLWELRNLVRWEADIVQRAALEAEDGGLKGALLELGDALTDAIDTADDRSRALLNFPAPMGMQDRMRNALDDIDRGFTGVEKVCWRPA